jgi:hypothetical protein
MFEKVGFHVLPLYATSAAVIMFDVCPVLSIDGLTTVRFLTTAVPETARNRAQPQPVVQVIFKPINEKLFPFNTPEKYVDPLAIGTTVISEQSTSLENSYALDRFAVVSSIFRSSAHVEIWYGLADDPVPPANAEAF